MKIGLCVTVFSAVLASSLADESTTKVVDAMVQQQRQALLEISRFPTWCRMVLHEAPDGNVISVGVSWFINNESGVVSRSFCALRAHGEIVTSTVCAPICSMEAAEVMDIATGLVSTVRSDGYNGWSGPLYGLDFTLDHPERPDVFVWKKWDRCTSILTNETLAKSVIRLRIIASNAFLRAESAGRPKRRRGVGP
jgi:hypothetical protein